MCVTINFNVVMSVAIKFINKLLHYVYVLMSLIDIHFCGSYETFLRMNKDCTFLCKRL
jgi:hypothetical protein